MSKNISTSFRATTLAYSSPAVGSTNTASDFFYNAFPDLNDVASDGSRSAFPRRAKYLLPLDSEFLPSAIWVDSNSIDEDCLASLDSGTREIIDKYGHLNPKFSLSRIPELYEIHRFEALFELTHKRLAATYSKWEFRTFIFAPLYTALENQLEKGQKIDVPLVPLANRRASQLQLHWAAVVDAFQPTLLLDEATSLLSCLILLPPEKWKAYEQTWVEQEEAENPECGFTDFYLKLRDEFNPESCTTETDRKALAEQLIDYAKRALSSPTIERDCSDEEVDVNLEEISQYVFWPSLLGEEVHRGLLQLRVHNDLAPRPVIEERIGFPEVMQWFMAFHALFNEEKRAFTHQGNGWPEFIMFSLEIGDGIAYPRITSAPSSFLPMLAQIGIKKVDGTDINPDPNNAPEGALIVKSISRYTIFLESIRQQICTGVGLCCPFWKGSGCCEFRPLLQRTYDVAKPWHPVWKRHWQRPPCLG